MPPIAAKFLSVVGLIGVMMSESKGSQWIPTHLTLEEFEFFVLPHRHTGSR